MQLRCNVLGLTTVLTQIAKGQTTATGSISGRVLSEDGRTLRAAVALSATLRSSTARTPATFRYPRLTTIIATLARTSRNDVAGGFNLS
jgi:hypothetical protein